MSRIVYALFSNNAAPRGGHKMIVRHVEELRRLGFDAILQIGHETNPPVFLDYDLRIYKHELFQDGDIIVLPEDAQKAARQVTEAGYRVVIFAQGLESLGTVTFPWLQAAESQVLPDFIAVAPHIAAIIRRAFPSARVEVTPAFADDRRFRPGAKTDRVAFMPWKRPDSAQAIRGFFNALHPRHAELQWTSISRVHENLVAEMLGSASLFLSLSKAETVGLTPLEAMASGCICAGFLGVGGQAFATNENGFWAAEDDCVMAADRLAEAADLVLTGGARLNERLEAGFETARRWSHAVFSAALEETWMRLGPATRISAHPLPPSG